MHRIIVIFLLVCLSFVQPAYGNKLRIAILDLKAGVGRNSSQINGLEDMLTNELFKSGYFTIVERSRVNQVLQANDLYGKNLTEAQYKILAEKLEVDAVLVGTINYIVRDVDNASDGSSKIDIGEYNVDLRLISVTGELLSSAAIHAKGRSERETMDLAARDIVRNLDNSAKDLKPYKSCMTTYMYSPKI